MKLKRKQWITGFFLLVIMVLLFTPLGFRVKVHVGRILATSAALLKTEMQTPLNTYEWRLIDVEGHIFEFEKKKGEVVLVNFWATWCPPCVAEMPGLQKLYNDYKGKVAFVFVAKDDAERVSNFLEKEGYRLPVYFSQTKEPEVLSSKVLPTTYIIDKKGKIVVAEVGAADWNNTGTRQLLDNLIQRD